MAKSPKTFNAAASNNPLINPPALPYGAPAFDKIKTEHFIPAIEWALEKVKEEIKAIKENKDEPSFENTIEALENAGEDFSRIAPIFHTFTSNNTTPELQKLEKKVNDLTNPVFSKISMDETLFNRIKAVYDNKDNLDLDTEQAMLLEKPLRTANDPVPCSERKIKSVWKKLIWHYRQKPPNLHKTPQTARPLITGLQQ